MGKYQPSIMGIAINGAGEPDGYFYVDAAKIEEKITNKTKASLVVYLSGQASDMAHTMEFAKLHNLRGVENCA